MNGSLERRGQIGMDRSGVVFGDLYSLAQIAGPLDCYKNGRGGVISQNQLTFRGLHTPTRADQGIEKSRVDQTAENENHKKPKPIQIKRSPDPDSIPIDLVIRAAAKKKPAAVDLRQSVKDGRSKGNDNVVFETGSGQTAGLNLSEIKRRHVEIKRAKLRRDLLVENDLSPELIDELLKED